LHQQIQSIVAAAMSNTHGGTIRSRTGGVAAEVAMAAELESAARQEQTAKESKLAEATRDLAERHELELARVAGEAAAQVQAELRAFEMEQAAVDSATELEALRERQSSARAAAAEEAAASAETLEARHAAEMRVLTAEAEVEILAARTKVETLRLTAERQVLAVAQQALATERDAFAVEVEMQRTRAGVEVGASAASSLPPHISAHSDPGSGTTYYLHDVSGESAWSVEELVQLMAARKHATARALLSVKRTSRESSRSPRGYSSEEPEFEVDADGEVTAEVTMDGEDSLLFRGEGGDEDGKLPESPPEAEGGPFSRPRIIRRGSFTIPL